MTIPLAQVNLTLLQATSGSGGRGVTPAPVVTDVVIGPKLTGPRPGTAGTTNTYTTTGGIPNGVMWFGFGVACSPFTIPCNPPAIFDIMPPLVFAPAPIDPGGIATLSLPVAPNIAGLTIMTQAIELAGSSCNVSNHVVHTFQ